MADKVNATFHPHTHHCLSCDRAWESRAAADACGVEDAAEDERSRRINRGVD